MARKLLREIALNDGAKYPQATCFAACCINILQQGCSYPSGVEKRIRKLLTGRNETVCADILLRMDAPRGGMKKSRNLGPPPPGYKTLHDTDGFPYFVRIEKSQHDTGRKRWRSRSPDRNDHKQVIYYEDKRPHEYNKYRPNQRYYRERYDRGRKRRRTHRPDSNQMGRMGSQR